MATCSLSMGGVGVSGGVMVVVYINSRRFYSYFSVALCGCIKWGGGIQGTFSCFPCATEHIFSFYWWVVVFKTLLVVLLVLTVHTTSSTGGGWNTRYW